MSYFDDIIKSMGLNGMRGNQISVNSLIMSNVRDAGTRELFNKTRRLLLGEESQKSTYDINEKFDPDRKYNEAPDILKDYYDMWAAYRLGKEYVKDYFRAKKDAIIRTKDEIVDYVGEKWTDFKNSKFMDKVREIAPTVLKVGKYVGIATLALAVAPVGIALAPIAGIGLGVYKLAPIVGRKIKEGFTTILNNKKVESALLTVGSKLKKCGSWIKEKSVSLAKGIADVAKKTASKVKSGTIYGLKAVYYGATVAAHKLKIPEAVAYWKAGTKAGIEDLKWAVNKVAENETVHGFIEFGKDLGHIGKVIGCEVVKKAKQVGRWISETAVPFFKNKKEQVQDFFMGLWTEHLNSSYESSKQNALRDIAIKQLYRAKTELHVEEGQKQLTASLKKLKSIQFRANAERLKNSVDDIADGNQAMVEMVEFDENGNVKQGSAKKGFVQDGKADMIPVAIESEVPEKYKQEFEKYKEEKIKEKEIKEKDAKAKDDKEKENKEKENKEKEPIKKAEKLDLDALKDEEFLKEHGKDINNIPKTKPEENEIVGGSAKLAQKLADDVKLKSEEAAQKQVEELIDKIKNGVKVGDDDKEKSEAEKSVDKVSQKLADGISKLEKGSAKEQEVKKDLDKLKNLYNDGITADQKNSVKSTIKSISDKLHVGLTEDDISVYTEGAFGAISAAKIGVGFKNIGAMIHAVTYAGNKYYDAKFDDTHIQKGAEFGLGILDMKKNGVTKENVQAIMVDVLTETQMISGAKLPVESISKIYASAFNVTDKKKAPSAINDIFKEAMKSVGTILKDNKINEDLGDKFNSAAEISDGLHNLYTNTQKAFEEGKADAFALQAANNLKILFEKATKTLTIMKKEDASKVTEQMGKYMGPVIDLLTGISDYRKAAEKTIEKNKKLHAIKQEDIEKNIEDTNFVHHMKMCINDLTKQNKDKDKKILADAVTKACFNLAGIAIGSNMVLTGLKTASDKVMSPGQMFMSYLAKKTDHELFVLDAFGSQEEYDKVVKEHKKYNLRKEDIDNEVLRLTKTGTVKDYANRVRAEIAMHLHEKANWEKQTGRKNVAKEIIDKDELKNSSLDEIYEQVGGTGKIKLVTGGRLLTPAQQKKRDKIKKEKLEEDQHLGLRK